MSDIYLQSSEGQTIPLPTGESTIGRHSSNSIVLDIVDISRYHARLHREGNHITITDLNSANGTFLNDQKLTPNTNYPVNPGQQVRFGKGLPYKLVSSQSGDDHTMRWDNAVPDRSPNLSKPAPQPVPMNYAPAHYAVFPRKPGKVQVVGVMCLVDGILTLLWALGVSGTLLVSLVGIICLPIMIYPLVLGVLEIVYGLKLIADPVTVEQPPQFLAIMQIINIVFGDVLALIVGIVSLVLYSDAEVQAYFAELRQSR